MQMAQSSRRVLAAALVALSAVVCPQTFVSGQQADQGDRLQRAVQKLDQGDTLGAMLELESILARDDEYWPAYFHLGRTQAQMGDDLGAKASFIRAAELDPGNAELHFMVATAAWQLADFEAAWNQLIAARQAGYAQAPVEDLMRSLDVYSNPPADIEQRLAAPRVVVIPAAAGAEAALLLRVRSAVFGARALGLVQDPAIANYRVEVSGTSDAWTTRVMGRDDDAVLLEHGTGSAATSGAIPGMEMSGLIRNLEALAGR